MSTNPYVEACERARHAVEAYTGKSTWDEPFNAFEWAVINTALEECQIAFDGDGNLFLVVDESDLHWHSLEDIVEHTLDLLAIGSHHPEDRRDGAIDKHRIVTALRAMADRIEAWSP